MNENEPDQKAIKKVLSGKLKNIDAVFCKIVSNILSYISFI